MLHNPNMEQAVRTDKLTGWQLALVGKAGVWKTQRQISHK